MKIQLKFAATLLLAVSLAFTSCGGDEGGDGNGSGDSVVTIAAIPGVVVPVRDASWDWRTTIDTDQYAGTIIWSPADNPFAESTVYTANIELTAKAGYTLTGVAENFFTVAGATAANAANSGTVTAVFPATGKDPDTDVTLSGVTQTGGTSGTDTTTALVLAFDVNPTTLTADNITVTGATKGALSGSGLTRSLAISDITVANGATVSVTVTSPEGFAITGSPQTVVVYRKLTIGMDYLGGKIGYLLKSGDPGYNSAVPHGLIVATANQSAGTVWITGGTTQTTWLNGTGAGGTSTAIGSGLANTDAIIARAEAAGTTDPTTYAAGLARAHNGGGYTDWYLPSENELRKIWENRDTIVGFSTGNYWSSSEASANQARAEEFYVGLQWMVSQNKNISTNFVRAVRSF